MHKAIGQDKQKFKPKIVHVFFLSSVRSAMCAASQLPGKKPTDVDDAPASA